MTPADISTLWSKLADDLSVAAISELLIRGIVNVLTEEPNRTVAQREVRTADVSRLETLRRIAVVGMAARVDAIDGRQVATRVVDGGAGADEPVFARPSVVIRPTGAIRPNLTHENRIREAVADVVEFGGPLVSADNPADGIARVVVCVRGTAGAEVAVGIPPPGAY